MPTNSQRFSCHRENGQDEIYDYLQQKSVWISTATEVPNPFVMH
jgi:(Z)-2-((N-methylformamido)methylene)-5-hydroxybutyrolactone dehydrogenase